MSLRLGDTAPNFKAITSQGPIDWYDYLGDHWGILFSHPADYTPVCTTELGKTAALKDEFDRRNTKVLALSIDSVEKHLGWIKDIHETQNCEISFPIIADHDRRIAEQYGFIHPQASDTGTVRSLLIIGPDKLVKLIITYPASVGRNFWEVLRVLDALQLASQYPVVTPANWQHGEKVLVSLSVPTPSAYRQFPMGVEVVNSYLRYTPMPGKQ